MSSRTVTLDLQWQEKKQFAFTVNTHVFNPIHSIVGQKLVELVLSEKVQVANKRVIDLGCGSGIVGLCAIARKAKKVLFTDINPHIDGIQNHPLFRKCDEWQVQDVLAEVPDSSYDMVLTAPPAMVVQEGRQIASDSFESGIFRPPNLYDKILADSGRVLVPGGRLVIWLRISLASFEPFIQVLTTAAEKFDMTSATLLAYGVESSICAADEKSLIGRWMYKFQKGGLLNDGLWMFLSLATRKS
jgi:methylase of polypeptide subunit release factors